jgi:hypothetical protein
MIIYSFELVELPLGKGCVEAVNLPCTLIGT